MKVVLRLFIKLVISLVCCTQTSVITTQHSYNVLVRHLAHVTPSLLPLSGHFVEVSFCSHLSLRHIMRHEVPPPSSPPPAVQELCEHHCTTRSFDEAVITPNGGYRVHVADSWLSDAVICCHNAASFPQRRKLPDRIQL